MNESVRVNGVSADAAGPLAEIVAEITDRLHAGERVALSEYIQCHPELAERLQTLLPALELLDAVGSSAGPDGRKLTGPDDPLTAIGTLGDFRIIRQVGRGGMGVVYEAEQISLGRRVALRVLPFAATMDPRQLQRFQNEARAAASLEHPHIVPVYGVGCERGVHYYAMKFIEGQSLAQVIGELKTTKETNRRDTENTEKNQNTAVSSLCSLRLCGSKDFFKSIAELGIQAAEALEHAHSVGIVHRDIKPANLMIDGRGALWVTDFGLARTAADAGLTMTGDVIGTLRYMSPEQAMAKHGLVDHRTDVYSLGVTLYEVLTGTPAVGGNDREQILNRITLDEPRSPRALDAAIPRDLETVVLKAMAKDPADRYSAAREVADDLRRFLEERPIKARRPSCVQRTVKWGRRHRALVGATALFLALAVVGLAVSVFLIWREQQVTKAALIEAQTNYARAEAQRRRAETNFREAYWTVENFLCVFRHDWDSRALSADELRRWQTDRALHFLAPFCEDPSKEPSARLQRGVAYVTGGRVYQILGEREKARQAFREAIAVFDRLVQDFPDDSTYPREHAQALAILAEDLYQSGQISDGNAYFRQAVRIWREAVRSHADDLETCLQLAAALCHWYDPEFRDPIAAVELARRAVELAPHFSYSWIALGVAYYRTGQWEAAVGAFQEAFQSKEIENRAGWTYALLFLAMAEWRCAKKEEAINIYHQAARRMEKSFLPHDQLHQTIRAEAAALLGIKEPPPPKAKEEAANKN